MLMLFIMNASVGVAITISHCIHILFNDKGCFNHTVTTKICTAQHCSTFYMLLTIK
jgi:hypothetical protein